MKIENKVELPAAVDEVWNLLDDVPRVATCMPGAELTEVVDEQTYRGTVAVKVGPVAMNYRGTVVVERRDPDEYEILLNASGRDRKGAGSAKANVVATLVPTSGGSTELAVSTDLQLTGRVASLGRGVQDVATKLFDEFADRINAEVTATSDPAPSPGAPDVETNAPSSVPADQSTGSRSPISLGSVLWSLLKDKLNAVFRRMRRTQ